MALTDDCRDTPQLIEKLASLAMTAGPQTCRLTTLVCRFSKTQASCRFVFFFIDK
jgi:hypothetical protein